MSGQRIQIPAEDVRRARREFGFIVNPQRAMARHGQYVREPGSVQMMRKGGRVTHRRMPRRNAKGRFVKR